ncbi:choice-of-anchor K domain-containing protein, partial [Aliarcobacter cibarius]|uniref:choice-of-anchor K domain-containing protein n=2 Tax=Aliarcobacter cibarius TaxID=255507 RepID=UPI00127A2818
NFVVEVKTFDDVTIEDTEEDYTLTVKVGNVEKTVTGKILDNDVPEAVITPKDPKDPTPEVPVDPTDPTKPLDPKDPSLGTEGAVAVEGEDLVFTVKVTDSVNPQTYDFVINNGTAEAGKDFTTKNVSFTNGVTYDPTTGKITVPAGVTEFEVVVKTIDDKIIEDTESLTVKVGTSTAVGYIIDNDIAPVITDVVVNVSEEGLIDGIKDNQGNPIDTIDQATVSGKMHIIDPNGDPINVVLTKPNEILFAKDLDGTFKAIEWIGDDTKSLIGKVGNTEVIKVTIDNDGNYKVDLLSPVKHPLNSVEDIVSLNFGVKVSDGGSTTIGNLKVNIEDDMPSVESNGVTWSETQNIPDIFTGNVSFKGSGTISNPYQASSIKFANGAVTVTGKGFKSATDLSLVDANVGQSNLGLGVVSKNSPYHNLSNEVDYRKTSDGKGVSEELTIKLENGKISYGAKISFEQMYGGELEVGVAYFYRDGKLVSTQTFSSDSASGNYAKNFEVKDGGFDTIIIKALDNGNGFNIKDNSDFTVSRIEFLGTSNAQPISYAEGVVSYGFGADGKGSLGFTGKVDNVTTLDGKPVTVTYTNNEIIAKDSLGKLVYQLQFTPATGKWEYFQYQKYLINDGVGEVLDVEFKVVDSDGDGAVSSIQIGVNKMPAIVAEDINVYEKGMASGTNSGDGSNITIGTFDIRNIDNLTSIKIANTFINITDLTSGNSIPSILVPNGELKIIGYDNGKVIYEYTLTQAHNHDKTKGEDLVVFKDIEITTIDKEGIIRDGEIKLGIYDDNPKASTDDSEAGGQILVVPVGQVDVGNLRAEFTKWIGGNSYTSAVNADTIPGKDTLTWGDSSKKSGYDFKGNTAYKNLSEDVINTQLNLGTFTHTNKPVPSGSAITEATLRIEIDVVIDGKSVHIVHDIVIDHNETPNTGSATQNRDIVTIKEQSFSQTINVGGKEYLFVIDGFLDKNGNIVKQVHTWEDGEQPAGQTNYNSFELFASIVSTDPLPKIEGNAYGDDAGSNAIFGADGKATNNAIVWQNGVVQSNGTTKVVGEYGTLIVDKNGHYEFELNRATYDNFKENDDKTATFKYTVTDADGDTRDSYVNIKLNGAIYENVDNIGRTIEGTAANDIIHGKEGNDYIYGGAGDDTIYGNGGRDVIYGGAGNDTIYTDLNTKNGVTQGDVFIDGGTGYDKLVLSGNDDIDLSVIRGKVSIKNIEKIDLTASNHSLKNLKLEDVVDMTDGRNELYIKGNLGDKVQLDLNEWDVKATNNGYKEYTGKGANSTVKLIIDDEIDISNI